MSNPNDAEATPEVWSTDIAQRRLLEATMGLWHAYSLDGFGELVWVVEGARVAQEALDDPASAAGAAFFAAIRDLMRSVEADLLGRDD